MEMKYAGALAERFTSEFGKSPAAFVSSPGRTELGGNHTDHQHGRVVAAAVTVSLEAAACATTDGHLRVFSRGMPPVDVDTTSLDADASERGSSAALVRGIAAGFAAKGMDLAGRGIALSVDGDVPVGSGLSSSACFELLVAKAMDELLFSGDTQASELAKMAQAAENRYFGKPCGLMDQLTVACGGVLAIDFADPQTPKTEKLALDLDAAGYALCLIDSGASHEGLTDEYAAITRDMCAVANELGKDVLREAPESEFYSKLPRLREKLGDRAVLRAMHFYAEDARAAAEADALRRSDIDAFLTLVRESGRSSAMYLQNLSVTGETRCQPLLLTQSVCEHILAGRGAVRVHGGGFAGSVLAFVPGDELDEFVRGVNGVLGNGACTVLYLRAEGPTVSRV